MKVCWKAQANENQSKTWATAVTGKGHFVQRLIPALARIGVKVIEDETAKVDIDVQISRRHYLPKNAKRSVVRMGPVHYDTNIDNGAKNREAKNAMKQSDGIVYQSEFARKMNDAFVWRPPKDKPTAVIMNGADPKAFEHCKPYPVSVAHSFLMSTREWVWEKRLGNVIDLFLEANLPDTVLLVAGKLWDTPSRFPPSQRHFEQHYAGYNVCFLGPTSQDVVGGLMKTATAMIHMVYNDACPNSVVEAMCAKLPVVATASGGHEEIIHGCNGGIIIEDQEIPVVPYDRRRPPPISPLAFTTALKVAINERERLIPDPAPVHIDAIAAQYKKFFEELL
jgi:glycosyltransferase involved in cell wall biosynthesis